MGVKLKKESIYIKGICVICNKEPQQFKGKIRGKDTYKHTCYICNYKKYTNNDWKPRIFGNDKFHYRKFKKDVCESCGFIPKHKCQLDVDHIDGNHDNDDPINLKTLCANCHRLKTYNNKINSEYVNIKYRGNR